MNTGTIFLAGAIALTGCTTTGQHRNGYWEDGLFPTYSDSSSESSRSPRENTSTLETDRHDRGRQPKRLDPATKQRIRALDKLEESLQKSLPPNIKLDKILYAVGVDQHNNRVFLFSDGAVQTQDQLDDTCKGAVSSTWVGGCFCQWKDAGEGGGLYANNAHMHCYDPYQ